MVKKNELGYWELDPKPTKAELQEFYNRKYFDSKNFEIKYTEEEFYHKQIPYIEAEYVYTEYSSQYNQEKDSNFSFLDVGCGEGFSLKYFSDKNWSVTGTDYSPDGVSRHFPHLREHLIVGDTEETLKILLKEGKSFDLINLNNVLEHLLDPVQTMDLLKALLRKNACLRIQVPNDYSALQQYLVEEKFVDRQFWFAPHEHMSYFDRDSLKKLFNYVGFSKVEALGDYPIDLNLLNQNTNYIMDSSKGKSCHWARVKLENFISKKSIKDLVTFRRGCGESGLGRNIIVYGRL